MKPCQGYYPHDKGMGDFWPTGGGGEFGPVKSYFDPDPHI